MLCVPVIITNLEYPSLLNTYPLLHTRHLKLQIIKPQRPLRLPDTSFEPTTNIPPCPEYSQIILST